MLHRDPSKESTELSWVDFARFVTLYCHNNDSDAQCVQMKNFINDFRDSVIVDKNSPVPDRKIKTSIEIAPKSIFLDDLRAIAKAFSPTAAAASGSAAAPTCQDHVNGKGTPNSIILTKKPSCIAYVNHNNIYEMQSLSGTKPKYSFKNFTIQLKDNTVNGTLEIDFSKGVNPITFTLKLDLNGRKDTDTSQFVTCMDANELTSINVTVTNVTMEGFMLTVIGTVTLQEIKDGEMYDFQGFVTKFADKYKFCTEGSGQRLENAPQLNRREPGALVLLIMGKMQLLNETMGGNAQYAKLKQMYLDFMQKYPNPNDKIDATPQNLATLNGIHDGMTALFEHRRSLSAQMSELSISP